MLEPFLQYCYVVAKGYYLAEGYVRPSNKALTIYVWCVVPPLWKMFMGGSDMIILLMTVDRFRVMRNIDQVLAQPILMSTKPKKLENFTNTIKI